ncbi:MAG TPA: DUF1631 domain-containing protein [Dokdonella sp.]|uniref:DUF1631 domain-containing protein n=1 Tax=Dokdonella sp. TaxID=2291710 RepID=UPI002BE439B0|nr:DUF1631 domain-containing protein [Dokdonella sp.]HUD43002.1 DUF1631 domain-containing protein [Dokdonella sp.]
MVSPDDSKKIIDLQQRQAVQSAAGDRLGDLLKRVRGIALKRIAGLVGVLFENIDDALFDLAEKAENNAAQTQFFDGMREVRKKRHLVERRFQEQVTRTFNEFAEGRARVARPEAAPQAGASLSLVDDQELEQSLAVSGMVAKANSRWSRALFQINQRLSVLTGGGNVDDAINPIGPAALGDAFREATREFDLGLHVRLIVYKLFDRYVMSGLDGLYEEVNTELIQAGVLPQIAATPVRAPGHAGGYAAPAAHGSDAASQPVAADSAPAHGAYDPASAWQAELYQTLNKLLAGRRGHSHDIGLPAALEPELAAPPVLSPVDLLSALTILQSQNPHGAQRQHAQAGAAQAVRQIKQDLLEQVERIGAADGHHHVSSADEDTIDLVGMLFEYILQDRNLPAQMQAVLSRLQIPYLKVAILDRHLFAQRAHPARRLLDALAQAGLGWSEEADPDHRLLDRVRQSVEKILTDFDDDLSIFQRELESFEAFLEQGRKRAGLAEQRVAEAARGRERLQDARRTAAREILLRIDERVLPPIIHAVLSRPWANYLVVALLRHGEQSDEWRNGLRFVDEFVWSALPKQTEADRQRLHKVKPQIERALRHGLGTIGLHDNEINETMRSLAEFYTSLQGGAPVERKTVREVVVERAGLSAAAVPAEQAETPVEQAADLAGSPVEEILLGAGTIEADRVEDELHEDEYLQRARALRPGTWLELVDEHGHRERAKLSWISPISSKYLFVNRRGLKVDDKTVTALAAELRAGTAVILEEAPLFDRALDAIVARLREDHEPA